jgi:hypothetical protein
MTARRRLSFALTLLVGALLAPSAEADWTLYAGAEFGIAKGTVEADGTSSTVAGPLDFHYEDASPLVGGMVGVEIPMRELTPWKLPGKAELPKWPMRFELEAVGLRQYPGVGSGFVGAVTFGETKTWSMMFDYWQDIPMDPLNRGIAKLFGRVPGLLRRTLNKTSFTMGAGIGFSSLEFEFTDGFHNASEQTYNFAWQAGGGFGYALTNAVTLTLGYRYFDYGTADGELLDSASTYEGPITIDQHSHEFRAGIRVRVWSFTNPWTKLPPS